MCFAFPDEWRLIIYKQAKLAALIGAHFDSVRTS